MFAAGVKLVLDGLPLSLLIRGDSGIDRDSHL